MYDKSLALDITECMINSVHKVIKRSQNINSPDDFLKDDDSLYFGILDEDIYLLKDTLEDIAIELKKK